MQAKGKALTPTRPHKETEKPTGTIYTHSLITNKTRVKLTRHRCKVLQRVSERAGARRSSHVSLHRAVSDVLRIGIYVHAEVLRMTSTCLLFKTSVYCIVCTDLQ